MSDAVRLVLAMEIRAAVPEDFELARALQIRCVGLDVWAFNTNARALFRSQGFETFNERMHILLPDADES